MGALPRLPPPGECSRILDRAPRPPRLGTSCHSLRRPCRTLRPMPRQLGEGTETHRKGRGRGSRLQMAASEAAIPDSALSPSIAPQPQQRGGLQQQPPEDLHRTFSRGTSTHSRCAQLPADLWPNNPGRRRLTTQSCLSLAEPVPTRVHRACGRGRVGDDARPSTPARLQPAIWPGANDCTRRSRQREGAVRLRPQWVAGLEFRTLEARAQLRSRSCSSQNLQCFLLTRETSIGSK